VREVVFIKQNKERWLSYEQHTSDPDELAQRFVNLVDDIGYARTHYPFSETVVYLNNLASNIYLSIYKARKREPNWFRRYFLEDIPLTIYRQRKVLLFASVFFILLYLIGIFIAQKDPNFIRAVLSDEYVNMTRENIDKGKPFGVYDEQHPFSMFVQIAWNNIRVALTTFSSFAYLLFYGLYYCIMSLFGQQPLAGWLAGCIIAVPLCYWLLRVYTRYRFRRDPASLYPLLHTELEEAVKDNDKGAYMPVTERYTPPELSVRIWRNVRITYFSFLLGLLCMAGALLILFYNGVMVGTFHQMFIAHGFGIKWIFVVMIHGTLELFSIAVAGACGIMLGNALLFPGTFKRITALRKAAVDAVKIMSVVILMLLVAAVFESYVTRYEDMPLPLSVVILLVCAGFIVLYFYLLPREVQRRCQTEDQRIRDEFLKIP